MMAERKKLALIVHSGTIDRLFAFILGSTSTSMDWETHLYFTFWGLNMLVKGAMENTGFPSPPRKQGRFAENEIGGDAVSAALGVASTHEGIRVTEDLRVQSLNGDVQSGERRSHPRSGSDRWSSDLPRSRVRCRHHLLV